MNTELDEQPLLPLFSKHKSILSKNLTKNSQKHVSAFQIKAKSRQVRMPKTLKSAHFCQKLVLAIGIYILVIFSIYLQDLPRFGGSNKTCKRFHYSAPESTKSNATYPFPNTFNVGKKLDFSGANTPTSWQNTQTLGYHNSYHKMNKPGDMTFWASWWMIGRVFPWSKALRYRRVLRKCRENGRKLLKMAKNDQN